MITIEQAQQLIEKQKKVYSPTDKKRLVIPAYGFSGAIDAKRVDWLPPTYEAKEYDVKGFEFHNPKDDAKQVLKQEDGCFIMYDAPGLKAKVEDYIKKNPKTFESADGLTKFVEFLKQHAIDPNTGKADIYDTDIAFAENLIGAPSKDKLKPGMAFVGAKKKETVKAIFIEEGELFQGAEGHPQKADKGGAYIVSDTSGMRLVQADVFMQAYALVSDPDHKVEVFKKATKDLQQPKTNKTKTFDEFFKNYKNYDDGGELDKAIIADAKKVYETLKTPAAIDKFYELRDYKKQNEMVPGLDDGHSGASFYAVCSAAKQYALYINNQGQMMINMKQAERQ